MRWRIVLLLLLLAASAGTLFSQPGCTALTPVVPTARPNGHAELMSDIILPCTGIASGNYSFSVYLNTPVTSRALTAGPTPSIEALLLVNDPDEGSQIACAASLAALGTCPTGSNVFQAALSSASSLVFRNVPVTASSFFLRITNVRADVTTLVGPFKQVMAQVAADGIPITNSTLSVACGISGSDGINVQLRRPDLTAMPVGGLALSRYVPLNADLAANPSSSVALDGVSFVLRIQENFGTAFKKMALPLTPPPDVNTRPAPATTPQDIPGLLYNTETGFYNPLFPTTDGLNVAGLATQATRIWIRFQSPIGVQVHAPVYERGKGLTDSRVRLIWSNADGSGLSYTPLTATSSVLGTYYDTAHPPYYLYVYEITAKGNVLPYAYDTIDLPFYLAHKASSSVGLGTTSVQVGLAPISIDNAYEPRFADASVPITVATTTGPALKAVIGAKTGLQGARIWQVGINNYGTGAATNVRLVNGLTLTQTYGALCSPPPSITSGIPVLLGSVNPGTTYSPVTINFLGCPVNARFTVVVPFTADGLGAGSTPFSNQTQ